MKKANDVFLTANTFAKIWEEHYGEEYYLTDADLAWASKIAHLPLDVIVKRTKVYLKDDYFKGCKHNLCKFREYINRWIEEPKAGKRTGPTTLQNALKTVRLLTCGDCGGQFKMGESHECNVKEESHEPRP